MAWGAGRGVIEFKVHLVAWAHKTYCFQITSLSSLLLSSVYFVFRPPLPPSHAPLLPGERSQHRGDADFKCMRERIKWRAGIKWGKNLFFLIRKQSRCFRRRRGNHTEPSVYRRRQSLTANYFILKGITRWASKYENCHWWKQMNNGRLATLTLLLLITTPPCMLLLLQI